ncbi:peptidoglycan-binding protein [Streptomyces sp. NPDC005728]|uniref:peptidoglycan-binding protein n=1 Tax=Streptomyces sp. NPDC005728 TaxID=3157054 RepID=UPI0033CED4D6
MTAPVFEEVDPVSDCGCPGCVHGRTSPRPQSGRLGGHSAARGVVVVAAAASAALGATPPAAAHATPHPSPRPGTPAADGNPATPQGARAPLHGPAGKPVKPSAPRIPPATRTEIINRAKVWVAAKVPYSMSAYWSDGYRQDCSGYVSMAWGLGTNEWTGSLDQFGVKITKEELQPGDILLFHNPANPEKGSHVVIFGGWTDYTHASYTVYEQTPPNTRRQATPYPYWTNADKYVPYRYKGVTAGTAGAQGEADGKAPVRFPGAEHFGPGANNTYVTQLGRMLIARGAGSFYANGPGPVWGEADRKATQAFQLAQGWKDKDADGLPGPRTWSLLVTGQGKDIKPGAASPARPGSPSARPASHGVPGYPGRNLFRPGAENEYVTQLGKQLVKKGFGRFYDTGPGSSWSEADRRAVQAFQRSQGWRGGAADGYPGPETWRRLFA